MKFCLTKKLMTPGEKAVRRENSRLLVQRPARQGRPDTVLWLALWDSVGLRFSWHWIPAPWSLGEVKMFFLPSLKDLFLDFFLLQRGTGRTSPLNLRVFLPKVILSMGCQNQCFCGEDECGKLLFHHLIDVPLYHCHLKSSKKSKSKDAYSVLAWFFYTFKYRAPFH